LPLGVEIDVKKQKMLLLDTGIFQRLLGLAEYAFIFGGKAFPFWDSSFAGKFWGAAGS